MKSFEALHKKFYFMYTCLQRKIIAAEDDEGPTSALPACLPIIDWTASVIAAIFADLIAIRRNRHARQCVPRARGQELDGVHAVVVALARSAGRGFGADAEIVTDRYAVIVAIGLNVVNLLYDFLRRGKGQTKANRDQGQSGDKVHFRCYFSNEVSLVSGQTLL